MGAGESKIALKQGILRLADPQAIPADDSYWASFWQLPDSQEDIFNLFSPTDIRKIRDEAFNNLETLILSVTSRLFSLAQHPSFPSPEAAPEREALNCIRILTRLIPYIYELEQLESWEERFFWKPRKRRDRVGQQAGRAEVLFDEAAPDTQQGEVQQPEDADVKPLAEELIDVLIELLFCSDFTIPRAQGRKKVQFTIWQSGVGCNSTIASTADMENRRMEILRLLLTLASKSMYTSTNVLPVQGVKAITYITTLADKQLVLTLLCSLLNTAIKYNSATWKLPYDHVVFKDPKQLYVTYCLQLLLVLVLYPVPETSDGTTPKNNFRHNLGRLHRPQDFQFLVDGMTRILSQPMQATSSYLPGSSKSVTWGPEMIMLFWELLQCNKRFRSFIVDTDRAHDFVISILFHAIEYRDDPSKQGLVRMCIFVLQTLSAEPSFSSKLNTPFRGQEALPQSVRIPNFHGTYMDFLITSIYTLITSSKGKIDAVYPALLAIINNVAPHAMDLGSLASSKLIQLFALMSSSTFLLSNDTNFRLLHSLIEAINAIIEHKYERNAVFIFAILRAHKRFYGLRDLVLEGGQSELDRQAAARKQESELPEGRSSRRRNGSTEGLRSPISARTPSLSDVPEEGGDATFAIGDDEESDDEQASQTRSAGSARGSRTSSIAGSVEDVVPTQIGGMSEKARGKMRVDSSSFSRVTSNASLSSIAASSYGPGTSFEPSAGWIDSWLVELPLHPTLTLIDHLLPQLPGQGASATTSAAIRVIRESPNPLSSIERGPIRVHLFEWSPLSLGWYESLLWSFIFSTEMTVMRGAPGTWKGTHIRLFRVQETPREGPSLMQPQGAVDAVGSSLVNKIGNLNLAQTLTQQGRTSGPRIRDV